MSIWATLAGTALGLVIGGPLGALAGAAAGGAVDAMRARATNPERRRVAFSIAAIALAAKMASADGNASAAEFATFQRLFHVDPSEAGNARRFYDLAKGSMAGFQAYAIQAADLLGQGSATLEDLLDALWMIAAVDGFHEAELAFLGEVATILGFDEAAQARTRRRHLAPAADDPWAVLGVEPGADAAALRAAYHALVKRYHPDRALAEGVPSEFIRVSELRMADINAAYDRLTGRRR
ncbi:DnaJ family molecular chaperone [Sandarakinorhabdus limnophila]|uniref:J domain-containing protein n=1 Tax=Sandarakinorhabdus limnophila TaxID=210512 RepID=UPI0026EACBDF|nr:DnaJ family molecular chaperone [Sandarakinorhabdus limnophila]